MQHTQPVDLVSEAERYLEAVELFRAEGCEPVWRLEPGARARRRAASRSKAPDPLELMQRRSK
jgi:hypothetical protein